jgi:membrane associated rhomboid family serine protease
MNADDTVTAAEEEAYKPLNAQEILFRIPITAWILLANFLMYSYMALLSGNFVVLSVDVQELFGVSGAAFAQWRYYVLLTAMFAHQDILHFGLNIFALVVIGLVFEREGGRKNFLIIYFLAGLITNTLSLILFPQYVFIGASAAIFGIAGATIMRQLQSVMFGALFILALFAMAPPMSFLSHGIGAVVGVLSDYFITKKTNMKKPTMRDKIAIYTKKSH